jgi:hypothetical protein
MNRKDFRPTDNNSSSLSDKDRETIKKHKFKNEQKAIKSGKDYTKIETINHVPMKYNKKTGHYEEDKGKKTEVETKETHFVQAKENKHRAYSKEYSGEYTGNDKSNNLQVKKQNETSKRNNYRVYQWNNTPNKNSKTLYFDVHSEKQAQDKVAKLNKKTPNKWVYAKTKR